MNYHFKTVWHFESPIDEVWDIIFASGEWPLWWKSVKKANIIKIRKEGYGSKIRYQFVGILPYRLNFEMSVTDMKRNTYIEGHVTGDLEGKGRWEFEREGRGSKVTYYWDVELHKKMLQHISPLVNPIFVWNHDYVMENGKKGLEKLLAKQ
ncbi:hypothetical protein BH09PAT1_BH09PAT1_0180 [soil metagenome]